MESLLSGTSLVIIISLGTILISLGTIFYVNKDKKKK